MTSDTFLRLRFRLRLLSKLLHNTGSSLKSWWLLVWSINFFLLRNLKIHYRIHKRPPLGLFLSKMNLVLHSLFCLRPTLILFCHIRTWLLPSKFPSIISWTSPLAYACCMSVPSYFNYPNNIMWRAKLKWSWTVRILESWFRIPLNALLYVHVGMVCIILHW